MIRMNCSSVIRRLRSLRNPRNVAGMARFGISTAGTLGVSIPVLRGLAKEIGTDHKLALQLWKTGIHEARLLAGFVGDPAELTDREMEAWVRDFDSWDICDQVCSNLFDRSPSAHRKAVAWSRRNGEFVKRAGFVMMAALSVHDKAATDGVFLKYLPIIKREAKDDRNFVRKAVNWALRQIGKRNETLNRAAIRTGEDIRRIESPSARWIAADALRELRSPAVRRRLERKPR